MMNGSLAFGVAVTLLTLILSTGPVTSQVTGLIKGRALVCYWGSWSYYRSGIGKFEISDMDANLCTHFIYSFIGINTDSTVRLQDPWLDVDSCSGGGLNNFKAAVDLRKQNPALKVMIAIGGWNETPTKFSNMSANAANRQTFIASVVQFLLRYDFDGLDIDWEYPAARGGSPADKPNFTLLVKELRQAFDGVVRAPGRGSLLLTAALPANVKLLTNGYELSSISPYLNYLNMMMYDFHDFYADGPFLFHQTGLYASPSDDAGNSTRNVNAVIEYLLKEGVPAKKIVMGVPTYGRTLMMSNPSQSDIYSPASGIGTAGLFTQENGYLSYYEVCQRLVGGTFQVVYDPYLKSPYAYDGSLWISYEDPDSALEKAMYIVAKGFGGGMVWAINDDDFRNTCDGISQFPITTTIAYVFEVSSPLKN